jgi:hypothetical protein
MMGEQPQGNGWSKWENHVLLELKRLNSCHDDVVKGQTEILQVVSTLKEEISALKVKAGIWGAAAGCLPVILLLGVWAVRSMGG